MKYFDVTYIFISTFSAFMVKGLAGFGDPLIYTPLLSVRLPNSTITPGMSLISPILNVSVVWKNRRYFSSKIVFQISLFVMIGIVPGTWLLKWGSPAGLKLLLGILILLLGIEMLTRKETAVNKDNTLVRSLVSFLSGLTAGLFGIDLLFLAYMERVTVSREEFRANTCFVFILENIFRIIMYTVEGMYTKQTLTLTLIAFPAAFLGINAGSALDKKMSAPTAHRFIIYIFILGGISTTIYAILQLI